MKRFVIDLEPEAFDDIQNAINYYNSIKPGLGKRFFNAIDNHFKFLKKNHYSFAIRYDDIRCMKVDKFPYMIHYRVLPKQGVISIKAVFSTHEDPNKWKNRNED